MGLWLNGRNGTLASRYGCSLILTSKRGEIVRQLYEEFKRDRFTVKDAKEAGIDLPSGFVASLKRDKILVPQIAGCARLQVWKLAPRVVVAIENWVQNKHD